MNPLYREIAATLLRALLLVALTAAVSHGWITPEQRERWLPFLLEQAVAYLPIAGVVLWSVWKTVTKRAKLNEAMASQPTTEAAVDRVVSGQTVAGTIQLAASQPLGP